MNTAVAGRPREALLMTISDVAAELRVGARTVWRWVSAGTFPPPDLSLGAKLRRWKRETVLSWIEQQAEGRAAR